MIYNCYKYANNRIEIGDIVFFKSINLFTVDNFSSAVIKSSPTIKNFYHVAMVTSITAEEVTLIDSTPKKGVSINQYKNLCKTHGFFSDIEVLRLDLPIEQKMDAVNIALNLIASEYNDIFSSDFINSNGNRSFYCSQIIQYAFNIAAQDNIFPDIKMNFKNNEGEFIGHWKIYYAGMSATIPQDEPGSHPSSIYESNFLQCF